MSEKKTRCSASAFLWAALGLVAFPHNTAMAAEDDQIFTLQLVSAAASQSAIERNL